MSENRDNKNEAAKQSVWKNRKKPFLLTEIIVGLVALVLTIYNFINWDIHLPLVSSLAFLILGVVFILRGIEFGLNKNEGSKTAFTLGLIIFTVALAPFVKYLLH